MKKFWQALCGMAAAFGWLTLQLLVGICVFTPPNALSLEVACGMAVQILCWAALLHCVKSGIWRGPAAPIFCGIFTLIDLWWIVRAVQRMLWYYYGFPQLRMDDIMGVLGVLFCAAGMCINLIAAVSVIRGWKKPNMA